jgi:hypothetical protein
MVMDLYNFHHYGKPSWQLLVRYLLFFYDQDFLVSVIFFSLACFALTLLIL